MSQDLQAIRVRHGKALPWWEDRIDEAKRAASGPLDFWEKMMGIALEEMNRARTDIPALIGEVERLRVELEFIKAFASLSMMGAENIVWSNRDGVNREYKARELYHEALRNCLDTAQAALEGAEEPGG